MTYTAAEKLPSMSLPPVLKYEVMDQAFSETNSENSKTFIYVQF